MNQETQIRGLQDIKIEATISELKARIGYILVIQNIIEMLRHQRKHLRVMSTLIRNLRKLTSLKN